MKPIEKSERYTLSKLLVEQLKQYIVNNNIQPGEKLPAERKLSIDMKVSRAILREALRSLESSGILELRHGEGAFVTAQSLTPLLEQLSFAAKRSAENVQELLEIRYMLEAAAIDELFVRYGAVPAETLAQAEALAADPDADAEFHLAIIRALGNDSLAQLAELFVLQAADAIGSETGSGMLPPVQAHQGYLDALKHGNPQQAKSILREHLGLRAGHGSHANG